MIETLNVCPVTHFKLFCHIYLPNSFESSAPWYHSSVMGVCTRLKIVLKPER